MQKNNTRRFHLLAKPSKNPLTRLLFWCSKTDPRLACVCSRWARATQAAFGVFVLFTSLLALGGMFYTLSNLNIPRPWPLWIAIAWSVFVLFLDREIVGGLDRGAAVVRPLMAVAWERLSRSSFNSLCSKTGSTKTLRRNTARTTRRSSRNPKRQAPLWRNDAAICKPA